MKAYLQHGEFGGPYRTESVPVRETEEPRSGRTLSGYGKRLPTPYMIKANGRWLRVRCICFSNSGTLYVTSGGRDIVTQIERESD